MRSPGGSGAVKNRARLRRADSFAFRATFRSDDPPRASCAILVRFADPDFVDSEFVDRDFVEFVDNRPTPNQPFR